MADHAQCFVDSSGAFPNSLLNLFVYFRQRITPTMWFDHQLQDIPLPVFREILKKQFTKNAHINDIRIIDRKVAECYKVTRQR